MTVLELRRKIPLTSKKIILAPNEHLRARAAQIFILLCGLLFVAEWFLAAANLGTFRALRHLRWAFIRLLAGMNLVATLLLD